ncbi:HNH endonuclease [Mycetocola manganoxydans]|uniref:HNH endonuclease n=1 Tax=Mycetocola manganoxydans TaxID=699879 RepID=A0A3L6ZMD4_9MICO|nr:HNH endonuclease signature motif containing protein [Mycetocola manganoxydans]RLP69069.1 HNH endonuclease [Mycetocola manganoxydans]GHD51650.1 hypothetical protein GCM10008097_26730 [Mycetocola manganoxydans]
MENPKEPPGDASSSGESASFGVPPVPVSWDEFDSAQWQSPILNLSSIESTYSGALADGCSSIVDEIAHLDRSANRQQAWRIERIDEARRLSEATLHGVQVLGSELSEAQQREMARRSLVAELACALRMPESTVVGMVTDAEALMHRLPATMAALREGDISYRHAQVLIDQTNTLAPEAALVLEEQALGYARTVTVAKLRVKTRRLRERLDPESISARAARSERDRCLCFEPADDGMAWLSLYTTAPEATSIYSAAREYAKAVKGSGDPRTLTQLTADVFTDAVSAGLSGDGDLVAHAHDTKTDAGIGVGGDPSPIVVPGPLRSGESGTRRGSGTAFGWIRPTVTVTVPALTLLGLTDEPAMLEGYGPIDPDTARALAGQSNTWYRMLTDPKTGAPIAFDSTTYRPTTAMKRYLRYIDGTCRFPGCNRAAQHCDLDHTKDHQFGGPTECENLSHLCPKHHRLKHQTTWRVEQRGGGLLEWTSPGGRTYVTEPEVLLTPPEPPPGNRASGQVTHPDPPTSARSPDSEQAPPF